MGAAEELKEGEEVTIPVENDGEIAKMKVLETTITNSIWQITSKLGFGGLLGVCCGYAIKQAAKVVMLVSGVAFLGLQGLSYAGYISVNWGKIKSDATAMLDTTGDGKVGVKDINYYVKKTLGILTFGGAGATGLSAGLYIGFTRT
eukprot:snap_masked-scaffold_78-processed-gene-0.49-mRNA-1 protein AED:0.37 eAED:0.38 QI:0/-1/0/1/-1/1/1/0/145